MKNIKNKQDEKINLQETAIKATYGTLKLLHNLSGDKTIYKLYSNLSHDIKHLKNYNIAEIISDAYDLVQDAYLYLHQRIILDNYKLTDKITVKNKNGKEITKDIYGWTCSVVRHQIYINKSKIQKNYVYFSDIFTDSSTLESDLLDRLYLRAGKYYDYGTTITSTGIVSSMDGIHVTDSPSETYKKIESFVKNMNLTDRQALILHYRRQGKNVEKIAKILKVQERTVYYHLAAIQKKFNETNKKHSLI